jgi:tRNA dimethylallyltransferase
MGTARRLRVVCGPTAAGKSALALQLAERHRLAVVSADSRQIYRAFDIGTAKPTPAEQAHVPHYGVDVADPGERWSAARWAEAAERWVTAARAGGMTPVVVGGTGFYLRALAQPLFQEPPLDPEHRARIAAELQGVPLDELRDRVRQLDPARAHLGRVQLARAIEVHALTGRRISDLHAERARGDAWMLHVLVVDPGPVLAERIESRVDAMLAAGWEDEVRALLAAVPLDAPAWQASGYGAVRDLVEGRLSRAAARERVIVETRQYAKRQRTWFRHQLAGASVTAVDPLAPDLETRLADWWEETS